MAFKEIEKKWQKKWEEAKIFEVKEDPNKPKFYCLEMFPYPSGEGLHMGHAFNYTIGDVFARFKRMQGYNVLYPMGYDSLGLPAENAAIKVGIHPKDYTNRAISNFIKQQRSLGLSYDWSKLIMTHEPSFYKWDQWIFLKMFEKGLAYRKKAPVNWCPKCNTVLANEQVLNGRCWRHEDTKVEIKHLEQWFFKITKYAEELYDYIDKLKDWPDDIKAMQKNWIGKSYGIEINFKINGEDWPILTTRPDTIYGVTFMVISAQHPRLMELVTEEQKEEVEKLLKKIKSTSEKDMEELEKEGASTGSYAINPLTNDKVPIYVGNFVIAEYGSGMVMGVPAHDQRDFEFAKKYNIPTKIVIQNKEKNLKVENMKRAYTDEGILVNSGKFNGLNSREAIEKISDYLEELKIGKRTVQYKLKDWLISRQRYWGTPIPIIYCDKCGVVPIPEKDLPVELPEKVKFGEGNPLTTNEEFVNTKCPKCGGPAKRETDTMDTFVNSSWYFLRYCDSKNDKEIFDEKKVEYWMPIDLYIGGKEHACMHLIYFRFYVKFLRDLGLLTFDEPVIKLFNQGMLHGPDGAVMSKSRGNVVLPETVSEVYGIDTARLFLVSLASPDKDVKWSDKGIKGTLKFINKIFKYFDKVKVGKSSRKVESKLNKIIKEVTEDIENLKYNLAVIKIRELFDSLEEEVSKDTLEKFLKLLSPFCPHITEELWEKLGNKEFISLAEWPKYDESK
jgi:leucyl-tRNA synthetase